MSINYETILNENNELKQKIILLQLELGYKYEIWVYNEKGVMVDKII